jgi:hypothetical protein
MVSLLLLVPMAVLVTWAMVIANPAGATALGVVLALFSNAFAAFVLLVSIGAIVQPARLVTDEAGLTLRTWFRTRRWSWSDVSNFRYLPSGSRTPVRIQFDALRAGGDKSRLAVLPAMWRVPGEAVARSLQEERDRYEGLRVYIPQASQRFGWSLAVAAVLVLIPLGLNLARTSGDEQADDQSDRYIQRIEFATLPGCPTTVKAYDYIPVRCDDPRYRIREQYDRYNLPRFKGSHWLRLGPDALAIGFCGSRACAVMQVVPNAFASAR